MMINNANQFLGIPSVFGIEYELGASVSNLLRVRLWLENLAVGTFDEETYLPSFFNQLERLVHPKVQVKKSEKVIESSRSMVSLGDTFDDFIVHSFLLRDQLSISARLVSSPFFEHPTWIGKSSVNITVDLAVAKDIILKFRSALL